MDDFFLNIDFNNYEIGREYFRYNKKCIFDIIREILVLETPEEIVRQKFVRYLIEELKVPKNKIEVEVPMVHFKKGSKGRADIVVYAENNEGYLIPLILVECKAPNVPLIDEVWKQAIKYNEILGAAIIVITNGNNTYAVVFDDETKEYYYIEEIPEYKEILSGGQF
ncbi:MAG: restriction endonuclease subunit R [Caloramator sp.]|nr:MAG: restriction endonuclease subunit R [Caloramator sp.]